MFCLNSNPHPERPKTTSTVLHQQTRIQPWAPYGTGRSDGALERPPHYAETPVSIRSALSPSDSVWRPMETWRHIGLFSTTYSSWNLVSIRLQALCSGFTQHLECPATVIYLRTLGSEGHLRCRRPKYFADGDMESMEAWRRLPPYGVFRVC